MLLAQLMDLGIQLFKYDVLWASVFAQLINRPDYRGSSYSLAFDASMQFDACVRHLGIFGS